MTKKSHQAKIKHHYVWGNYLKRWSPNNKDIYYTTKKGKIAFDSVKGIAREHNFYRVNWLSDTHIEIIKALSRRSPEYLQRYHLLCLERFLKHQERGEKNIRASMIFECNGLEDLHTLNENEAQHIMQALANRNLEILDIEKNMLKYCIYIGHQFARTKSFRENSLNLGAAYISKEHPLVGKAIAECSWFLSYIFGMNFGVDLFNTRNSDKHCLLINNTELPFVTSDQPIVNVFGPSQRASFTPPKDGELELYYPISPKVAYMINKTNRFQQGASVATIETVTAFNTIMSRKADTFIASNTSESLVSLLKNRGTHTKEFKQLLGAESS